MEESEKMTALKKAYAEIILNSSKEAAVKIMASERKARKFEHNLSMAKEEALRLLLRVKQTMDAKINEAEMKSLSQQNRIDELEAQLQEAEEIVGNLRSDLNEVHKRLEETVKTQKHNPPEMTGKTVCDEKYACNGANRHDVVNNSRVQDAPSVIMRSKKPELYRNGCTQRIHAYEGPLLNGHFPLSDKGERVFVTPPLPSEITFHVEDNPVEVKEVINEGKASYKVSSLIRRKRKRGARYRRSYTSPLQPIPHLTATSNSTTSLGNSNVREIFAPNEDEDREVANSLVLIREQTSSTPQVEFENVPCVNLDSEKVDGVPSSPPVKERVLKYTFQRKRKKEMLSRDNSISLIQENTLRRKMGKKHNGSVQPSKSADSSRDSRRMAQVARQLISLSEKKW